MRKSARPSLGAAFVVSGGLYADHHTRGPARDALRRIVDDRRRPLAHILRARIVLLSDERLPVLEVARQAGVGRPTVWRWQQRFAEQGLDDAPRSGAPHEVEDEEEVERLVALTRETPPEGATHWSTRDMAKRVGMSQTMVSRIWRAFGLAPHRADAFKLSTDPAFVDKVRDVVGLHMNPPERALVLCVDEKPQIQAVEGTAAVPSMRPGQPERRTHDHGRNGTTDLFAALNVATGEVIGQCHRG